MVGNNSISFFNSLISFATNYELNHSPLSLNKAPEEFADENRDLHKLLQEGSKFCFERMGDDRIFPIFDEPNIREGLGGGHNVLKPLES